MTASTGAAALPSPSPDGQEVKTARLMALLDPAFLAEAGWAPDRLQLCPPPEHPLLARGICRVANCDGLAQARGMCPTCNNRYRTREGMPLEEFVAIPRGPQRKGQEVLCAVPGCPRVRRRISTGLCPSHDVAYIKQQRYQHLLVAEFVAQPTVRPLPDWGYCHVESCSRKRDSGHEFCKPHRDRWVKHLRDQPAATKAEWARTAWPIAFGHMVGMHGLPPLVIAELLFGLQYRCRRGNVTSPHTLRSIVHAVRTHRAGSIFELPDTLPRTHGQYVATMRQAISQALSSPEEERRKDVWNLRVFGHPGELRFTGITQHWLRETAKRWAVDDLPRRRGFVVAGTIQERLNSVERLSDSLRIQRGDRGHDPVVLGRRDIENFLNRMAFLAEMGEISENQRVLTCRHVAKIIRDIRALGATGPDEPAAGLPEAFALRSVDVPRQVKVDGPGRALPQAVLRQLYDTLPRLETATSGHVRNAVELLMDTGRRPEEVFRLGFDCLAVGDDGKHVLVFTEHKNNRQKRLPITETTAELIRRQQKTVRSWFPDTPVSDLTLFPAKQRNRHGTRSITENSVTGPHREWVDALPPLLLPDGGEFDKANVVLYSYRHSYAQRHADAGTGPDVLRELMGHKQLGTTQTYYRVTEKRVRKAVDQLVAFQFDRHGNRVWPEAKALLDHEHARMRVGAVAVPFGTCSEPSNVKAGGHACPFRFRCLGCGHFRTDPSYLPELRDYLHTLLRDRERVQAASELDAWAAAEALPSDEEIDRVRALIRRTEEAVDELSDTERTELEEATSALRKVRRVHLGLPGMAPPRTDPRLERDA